MKPDEVITSFKVRRSTMERMQEEARHHGEPVTAFARRLLSMGFNAYFRAQLPLPESNDELDGQVKLVMCLAGQADHAAISRATGVQQTLVEAIFDGFSILRAGRAVVREVAATAKALTAPSEDAPPAGGGGVVSMRTCRPGSVSFGARGRRQRKSPRRSGQPPRPSPSSRSVIATFARLVGEVIRP